MLATAAITVRAFLDLLVEPAWDRWLVRLCMCLDIFVWWNMYISLMSSPRKCYMKLSGKTSKLSTAATTWGRGKDIPRNAFGISLRLHT
jgi:hypothetical protein